MKQLSYFRKLTIQLMLEKPLPNWKRGRSRTLKETLGYQ